ncbi:MAG: pilus assembly protein TadG-related protein [Methylophilaceae bacterium]|jgi:hypothetical protein|nr:pilus assembly protein TadG-related protein [Methyloradius sp.]
MNQRFSIAELAMAYPRKQRGQSIVFITVTSVIVLLVTLVTFNSGQLSYHRIKLQNTADAAAYSAAVAEARDLNFAAYMNRGMIANQVAVAQIVSLTGWSRNFYDTYNGEYVSIQETISSFSSLKAMWSTPFNVAKGFSNGIKSVLDPVAGPAVKAIDFLIDGLYYASKAYHLAVVASIPLQVIPNVVEANEPEAKVSDFGNLALAAYAANYYTFTKSFSPSGNTDGDDRMAKVTQASTDVFYKDRSLPPIWPLPILIDPTRLFTYGVGPLLMMQFHSGGSVLKNNTNVADQNMKGWDSLDSTGLFVIMCLTIPVFGIPVPIPFPLPPLPAGAGAAAAGNSAWISSQGLGLSNNFGHRNPANTDVDPLATFPYGGVHVNPMTAIPAWIKVAEGPGANLDSRAGIRDYYDLAANIKSNASQQANATNKTNLNDVAPSWVVEVERPNSSLITSSTGDYTIGGGSDGKLNLPMGNPSNNLRALSKAQAYFSRPSSQFVRAQGSPEWGIFKRDDGKTEWGSLYSPYWQARLVPNSIFEQGLSIIGTGLL